jgi:hypothetical protein
MLVSDLINLSFLNIGSIAAGETPTSAELADAFTRLNLMLGQWSIEQLTVPQPVHQNFAVTAGVASYTLGTGGTLVTAARPIRVTGAASVSGNFRQAMEVMSFEKFSATVQDPLASTSVLALKLAADNGNPSINLRVFPVPAAGPGSLWLDYWTAIAQFGASSDNVTLSPEVVNALHLNLSVLLYPQYARTGGLDPIVAANAQMAKASLVALNQSILAGSQPTPQAAQ